MSGFEIRSMGVDCPECDTANDLHTLILYDNNWIKKIRCKGCNHLFKLTLSINKIARKK